LALGIESSRELSTRWMASPSHRDNIVSPIYEDVGVGVTVAYHAEAGRPASYVVVYFGKKRPEAVVPSNTTVQTSSVPKADVGGGVTQSTVVSSGQTIPQILPASHSLSLSPDQEKIRLLSQLVIYLDSYLRLLRLNAGQI
jgi:hypothetical protein